MTKSIAERIFDGRFAQNDLEEKLDSAGVQYERLRFDYYDNSLELYDVSDDYRMSTEVQKIIHTAGFSRVFVNHINKWETHYTFSAKEFVAHEGWRVSYPHKRDDGGAIMVEKIVGSWPSEWFKTGYVIVKDQSK